MKKKIIVEIVNTTEEYKWRMRFGTFETDWERDHKSILVLDMNGEKWGYVTDYYSGTGLPVERPFLIRECEEGYYELKEVTSVASKEHTVLS